MITADVMFADRLAKMQFGSEFSVITQASTGTMIIAKNQSFQNNHIGKSIDLTRWNESQAGPGLGSYLVLPVLAYNAADADAQLALKSSNAEIAHRSILKLVV